MMISIGREVSCTELPFVAVVYLDVGEAPMAGGDGIVLRLEPQDLESTELGHAEPGSQRSFKPYESYSNDDGSLALIYRDNVKGLRPGAYRVKLYSIREGEIPRDDANVWLLDRESYFYKGQVENSEEFVALPTVSAREAAAEIAAYFAERQFDPGRALRSIAPVAERDRSTFEFLSYQRLDSDISIAASKVLYIAEGLGKDYRYLAHFGLFSLMNHPRNSSFHPSSLTFSGEDAGAFRVDMRLQLRTLLSEEGWRAFKEYSETAQMSRFGSTDFKFTFSQDEPGLVNIGVTFVSETERSVAAAAAM